MPVKDRISPARNTYFDEQPLTFLPGLLTPILSVSSVLPVGGLPGGGVLQEAAGSCKTASRVSDSSYLAVVRCGSGSGLLRCASRRPLLRGGGGET